MRACWAGLAVALALGGCARERQQAAALVRGDEPVIAGTLEGGPWGGEDINGGGIMDYARVDMTFADGAVSGLAGCNRYSGAFRQSGAAVTVGALATTRKLCAPALMETERKFLGALEAATKLRFDATGAAFLVAEDGRILKARR